MQVRHATYGIHKFFITDDNFARNHDWEAIFDRLIELRDKALFWCRFVWGTLYKQAILVFTIGRLVLVKAGIDRDPNRQAYMEPASGSVVHPGANVRDDGRYPEGREVWGAGRDSTATLTPGMAPCVDLIVFPRGGSCTFSHTKSRPMLPQLNEPPLPQISSYRVSTHSYGIARCSLRDSIW